MQALVGGGLGQHVVSTTEMSTSFTVPGYRKGEIHRASTTITIVKDAKTLTSPVRIGHHRSSLSDLAPAQHREHIRSARTQFVWFITKITVATEAAMLTRSLTKLVTSNP